MSTPVQLERLATFSPTSGAASPIVVTFDPVPPGSVYTVSISASISQTITAGANSQFPAGSNTHNELLQSIIWTLYRNASPQFTWVGTAVLHDLQLYRNDQVVVVGHLPGGNTALVGSTPVPLPVSVWMTGYSDDDGYAPSVTPSVSGGQALTNSDSPLVSDHGSLADPNFPPIPASGQRQYGLFEVSTYSAVQIYFTGNTNPSGIRLSVFFYSDSAGTNSIGQAESYIWDFPVAQGLPTGMKVIIPTLAVAMRIILKNIDATHSGTFFLDVFSSNTPVDVATYPVQPYLFTQGLPALINVPANTGLADVLTRQIVGGQATFTLAQTALAPVVVIIYAVDVLGNHIGVVWGGISANGFITGSFTAPGTILAVSIFNQSVTTATQIAYSLTLAGTE